MLSLSFFSAVCMPSPPYIPSSHPCFLLALFVDIYHPSFHPHAEKVRSNDAESAKPFKVESGVQSLFGSMLAQSSVCSLTAFMCVCVCAFIGQTFNNTEKHLMLLL